jgi:hypothetical protein
LFYPSPTYLPQKSVWSYGGIFCIYFILRQHIRLENQFKAMAGFSVFVLSFANIFASKISLKLWRDYLYLFYPKKSKKHNFSNKKNNFESMATFSIFI